MVFGGEGLEEEGGEGGGGDVLGSEAEDVLFLFARIELGVLSKLKRKHLIPPISHWCVQAGPSHHHQTNELPRECGRAPLLLLCRWEFRLYCLVWYFKQIGGM